MTTPASSSPVDVGLIDAHDAAAFDEWFAVWHLIDEEVWPDLPGWQRTERLGRALDRDGPEEHRCLVAHRGGDVVGVADLETFRRENRHVARLDVRVLPGHRRQGVGGAIVAMAARLARAEGRTELGGMDQTPVRTGFVDVAGPFARSLGFVPALPMVRRMLRIPLAPHRERHLREGRTAPEGYTLLTWTDRWPDEYLEDRCEFGRRMSTDVPVGEQELDEEVWDPARVRALEANLVAQDRAKVTTAARHDASGRLVAFTEVVVPRGAPESAWQHDTLVVREHRGHGLGFAVKVANLWALLERHPAVRAVSTWNAAENEHMIAVNDAIGFEVLAHSVYWRKPLGT